MTERAMKSFEDLRVFNDARALANRIYEISRENPLAKEYSLADQMRRSALSVMSNVAEGLERQTGPEFIHFLYIAKASCGELRAQLLLAFDQKYVAQPTHEELNSACRKISVG